MAAISEEVARHLGYLELEGASLDDKLRRMIEQEYRRRLARYQHTDRLMQRKYGMTHAELEARLVVREHGYSWEVESDASEWELALDGVATMKRRLQELMGQVAFPSFRRS